MKLLYKAATTEGKIVSGIIEAQDIAEAGTLLRKSGLLPISISEKGSGWLRFLPFVGRSTASDLVFFTRQLSSMLSSGLTLMQSLRILRDQVGKASMAEVVGGIIADVEEGKPLSLALEKYKEVFSPIYVSLIKAAETSGLLDKVLTRLADNLEKQERLKNTIKGALIYPAVIVVGMLAVTVVMMLVVVPQLSLLYQSLNISLPLPTRVIIALSNLITAFWPIILGFWVLAFFFFRRWRKTEAGMLIVDNLTLRLPVFGNLLKQTILTELTRTFGLMVGSGALIVDALKETAQVSGNLLYRNAILAASERVEKGISVGDALSSSSLFPPILVEMVRIGEQIGKLDEQLLRVSDYFEKEVDQSIKNLTTLMEPFIIVVLGSGVGFLIISVISPIYNLISSLQ